jgi:hypothetical protein
MCQKLSLWWSEGADDCVFWRSQSSGGRATSRAKKQLGTDGQFGDIAADRESGRKLIDLFMIELKRGYNTENPGNLMDRLPSAAFRDHSLEGWIAKLEASLEDSGTFSWWLIHRRDRRRPIIYLPAESYRTLKGEGFLRRRAFPMMRMDCRIQTRSAAFEIKLVATDFEKWLEALDPMKIRNFQGIL